MHLFDFSANQYLDSGNEAIICNNAVVCESFDIGLITTRDIPTLLQEESAMIAAYSFNTWASMFYHSNDYEG